MVLDKERGRESLVEKEKKRMIGEERISHEREEEKEEEGNV